jgi:hypothetical protein
MGEENKQKKGKDIMSKIFTLHEASKYLRVKHNILTSQLKSNNVPHFYLLGELRFKKEELDKWLKDTLNISIDPVPLPIDNEQVDEEDEEETIEEEIDEDIKEISDKENGENEHEVERKTSQICCKVTDEEYSVLEELTVIATNQVGKGINIASVIRSLIEFGKENKERLKFSSMKENDLSVVKKIELKEIFDMPKFVLPISDLEVKGKLTEKPTLYLTEHQYDILQSIKGIFDEKDPDDSICSLMISGSTETERSGNMDESAKIERKQHRNFPVVGFTISIENHKRLEEMQLFFTNKFKRIIGKSELMRMMIRFSYKHKDKLIDFIDEGCNEE